MRNPDEYAKAMVLASDSGRFISGLSKYEQIRIRDALALGSSLGGAKLVSHLTAVVVKNAGLDVHEPEVKQLINNERRGNRQCQSVSTALKSREDPSSEKLLDTWRALDGRPRGTDKRPLPVSSDEYAQHIYRLLGVNRPRAVLQEVSPAKSQARTPAQPPSAAVSPSAGHERAGAGAAAAVGDLQFQPPSTEITAACTETVGVDVFK